MTNSLQAMQERMQQWMNEKPSYDGGDELRLRKDDLVVFNFAANGDEGDRFIKIYRSHIVESISSKGTKFNKAIYCPIQSGEAETECQLCAQGHTSVKERMSIWMYVKNILHTQMPPEKQFPQVMHENRVYFNEELNAFKRWDTSAWRESPWGDICKLNDLYKGLHNFTAQLVSVGDGLTRRYKLYAIPLSDPLTPELYAKAQAECQPINEMLVAQLGSPVVVNPTTPAPIVGVVLGTPAAAVTPFSIGGSASIPTLFGANANNAVPNETTPSELTPVPEEDTRRPMQKMF